MGAGVGTAPDAAAADDAHQRAAGESAGADAHAKPARAAARSDTARRDLQKLIDALQVERAGIASLPHMERINATMAKATLYSAKIARMRKTMDATSAQMAATKKQVSNWQAQFAKGRSPARDARAKRHTRPSLTPTPLVRVR